jgi:hypothetical protein
VERQTELVTCQSVFFPHTWCSGADLTIHDDSSLVSKAASRVPPEVGMTIHNPAQKFVAAAESPKK